jgi:NAD(P)-dependent dehydrogenase (short-subunit alcohol dehydrogenase family)
MINLDGRNLIIVGGGNGIGFAAARLAVEFGAKVVVADSELGHEAAVSAIGAKFVQCDAIDRAAAGRAIDTASEMCGGIDALITTVGGAKLGNFEDMSVEDWDREIRFNLTSVYVVAQAVLPHLRRRGGGALVTTSSGYGLMAGPDRVAYTAAKAGVIAMTRSLAAAVASMKIRVNCVAPGPTDTPRFRNMNGGDERVERVRQAMPLGRIPLPADCAKAALFLISDAASEITGQVIHVNGGLLMH